MDLNNDGLLDLVAGDADGQVTFFKNIGTKKEPKLAEGVKLEADGKPIKGVSPKYEVVDGKVKITPADPKAISGMYSKLHLTDWDGDGLLDILIGQDPPSGADPQLVCYKNVGTKTAPKFAAPVAMDILKGNRLARPSPFVVDWDGDGKRDVLLGTDSQQVMFVRNIGTNEKPEFEAPVPIELKGMNKCYRLRVHVCDWNNDGKLDLLVGTFYSEGARGGNVWLFLRK